jgi:hypothetical protein
MGDVPWKRERRVFFCIRKPIGIKCGHSGVTPYWRRNMTNCAESENWVDIDVTAG